MPASPDQPLLPPPGVEFAFSLAIQAGPIVELGVIPAGGRRCIPILGGTFAGPRIRGRILPGADWQIVRNDGVIEIDARYALETEDGARIAIADQGVRRNAEQAGGAAGLAEVYFRTAARFEVAAPQYQWLARSVFLGTGRRLEATVVREFWRVL